jgi:hypothetical protein
MYKLVLLSHLIVKEQVVAQLSLLITTSWLVVIALSHTVKLLLSFKKLTLVVK